VTSELKRAVIKEELVALTGDAIAAVILQQMLYWTERINDFDKFLAEEKERDPDITIEPRNGWIYKTADQLLDEIMLTVSSGTIARRFRELVEKGWLWRRRNPKHKWDRTWQYRANLDKIRADLAPLGYVLEGYRFDVPNDQDVTSICHSDRSMVRPNATIPETTTEITSQTTSKKRRAKRAPSKADPRTAHPAIECVREVTKRRPPKEVYDDVIAALGDSPDIMLAQRCFKEWCTRGYNRMSLIPFVEWYPQGGPSYGKRGNGKRQQAPEHTAMEFYEASQNTIQGKRVRARLEAGGT